MTLEIDLMRSDAARAEPSRHRAIDVVEIAHVLEDGLRDYEVRRGRRNDIRSIPRGEVTDTSDELRRGL